MTSDGSPYGRFQKALKTGNVNLALAAARELPKINLSDSLRLCLLLRGTNLFERAALRWHGRYCREVVAVDLDEAQAVLACLACLRGPRAEVAARALVGLLDPVQVRSARVELAEWGTNGREGPGRSF
jgi:hypothetical protein